MADCQTKGWGQKRRLSRSKALEASRCWSDLNLLKAVFKPNVFFHGLNRLLVFAARRTWICSGYLSDFFIFSLLIAPADPERMIPNILAIRFAAACASRRLPLIIVRPQHFLNILSCYFKPPIRILQSSSLCRRHRRPLFLVHNSNGVYSKISVEQLRENFYNLETCTFFLNPSCKSPM